MPLMRLKDGRVACYSEYGEFLGIMETDNSSVERKESKASAFDSLAISLLNKARNFRFGEKAYLRYVADTSESVMKRLTAQMLLDNEDMEEDGGPGSGNWGHRGRPGEVGGSGKGGGAQYRGGRSDIAYHSSKADWMNGLKGDRQNEAQKFLNRMKINFQQGEEKNRSVEQNIMASAGAGSEKIKKQLIDYMAEARGWDKYANRLIDENLDENEKKLVNELAAKYGFLGSPEIPDDVSTAGWDKDDLSCWMDLKSKAMGGPVSGKEPPDELMYGAGLKEKPKDVIEKKAEFVIPSGMEKALKFIHNTSGVRNVDIPLSDILAKEGRSWDATDVNGTCENLQLLVNKIADGELSKEDVGKVGFAFVLMNGSSSHDNTIAESFKNAGNGGALSQNDVDFVKGLMEQYTGHVYADDNFSIGAHAVDLMRSPAFDNLTDDEAKRASLIFAKSIGFEPVEGDPVQKVKEAIQKEEDERKAAKAKKADSFTKNVSANIDKINKANTVDDVTAALKDSGAFKDGALIDFHYDSSGDPVSLETAKSAGKAFANIGQHLPFMAGEFTGIRINENSSTNIYASCRMFADDDDPNAGIINISRAILDSNDDAQEKYQKNVDDNLHPKGTIPPGGTEAVITHEIGHAVDRWVSVKLGKFNIGSRRSWYESGKEHTLGSELRTSVLRKMKIKVKDTDAIAEALSKYASYDPQEFFAEAFAEAYLSPNPRPVAAEFKRQFEAILRENNLL